ncbi:MAG: OmpA family protein [Elusimicrobia bacterium]|nr:OmpA family protein [Elusimicrobiota bacterium]
MRRLNFLFVASMVISACVTPGKKTAVGTGAGAAAGAGVGAVVGHQSGNAGKGAAIGAAVGALLGGTIGNRLDRQAKELAVLTETRRTEEGIVATLKNSLLFDSGKSDLKPRAAENIKKITDVVKKYPENHIVVVGYTDDQGAGEYNQRLSEQRAQAVRLAMITQGFPASAVEAIGRGEANPVASNNTAEGRAKNRRVELLISVEQVKKK